MAIEQHNPQTGECSQQAGDRFEMKMAIHEELRVAELRRQILLAPKALSGAGKHRLAMRAVSAQVLRQTDNPINICAG